ncbi:MAG TPA: M18 family aminopeptidase [Methylothermaceae bacterium]|nr:M18 family aminopeptidase [Methylothermaceae bacterium]
MAAIDPRRRRQAEGLLRYIDAAPSPWHAAAVLGEWLETEGFICLNEAESWHLDAGGRYYLLRDDSSLIAFSIGQAPLEQAGFRIVGAHTDSPGLRLKPNAPHAADPLVRLGVEIYGSPILATWTDRDLSLAGRVALRCEPPAVCLVDFETPLLRLPNLAIHMNRKVNEDGLKLDKHKELPLLLGALQEELPPSQQFRGLLAERLDCDPEAILGWELNVYDTQKGAFWGAEQEFVASARLDNLASCHAAVSALIATEENDATCICALFDHEEVGSESFKGAAGALLQDCLVRIAAALGLDAAAQRRASAGSMLLSADMAHAYQPNFPQAYDEHHKVVVNGGPVIKTNANLRYTGDAFAEALFIGWCEEAQVPWQRYVHRSDIPCGSTIGPLVSARLGLRSLDIGNPLWAMHSIRESAGVLDYAWMIQVLERFFACPRLPVSG